MNDRELAACPFYKYCRHNAHKICCEGPIPDTSVSINFRCGRDLRIHIETFCKDKYEFCELYGPTIAKYEEE